MPRTGRRSLTAAILTLYGAVALGGLGLHALFEPGSTTETTGAAVKPLANHCPVCEFQSQGQIGTEPVAVVSQPLGSPHVALPTVSVAGTDPRLPSHPRAPPRPTS